MKHRGSLTFGIGRIKRKTKNTIVRTVPKFNTKIVEICHNVLLFFFFFFCFIIDKQIYFTANKYHKRTKTKQKKSERIREWLLFNVNSRTSEFSKTKKNYETVHNMHRSSLIFRKVAIIVWSKIRIHYYIIVCAMCL